MMLTNDCDELKYIRTTFLGTSAEAALPPKLMPAAFPGKLKPGTKRVYNLDA